MATSLAGTSHIIIGRVRNGVGEPYHNEADAIRHLTGIGWTNLHFLKDKS